MKAFFVRKETKQHGLQRRVEGPPLEPGERCLIVEDVVTTGGSTVEAIEAVRAEGHDVCGVVAILDRLAGGARRDRGAAGRRAVRGAGDDRRRLPGPPRPLSSRRRTSTAALKGRDGRLLDTNASPTCATAHSIAGRRRMLRHACSPRPDAATRKTPRAGFEPAAYSLGGSRSIQLSYRG